MSTRFAVAARGLMVITLSVVISIAMLAISPNHPSIASQEKPNQLEATLQVKEAVPSGEPVILAFTLTNTTANELYVLKWFTPLEGIAGEIFNVELNGEPVPYQGILAKRGDPIAEDYQRLGSGESVTTEVDLAGSYELLKPGSYSIQYLSPSISYTTSSESNLAESQKELGPVGIASEPVRLEILGPEASKQSEAGGQAEPKAPLYSGCNDTQETTISTSDASATLSTAFCYSYLNNLSADARKTDAEYKTWFGAYDDTRYNKVVGNWKKVNDTFTNQAVTYNCSQSGCASNWYAYVQVGGALEVFLCPKFWTAPDTGVDTKFGTIIHEVSHEVAGTKDHAYGVSSCKNLATNDPAKAVENADCYEYFAEHHKATIGPESLVLPVLLIMAIVFVEGYRRYRRMRASVA